MSSEDRTWLRSLGDDGDLARPYDEPLDDPRDSKHHTLSTSSELGFDANTAYRGRDSVPDTISASLLSKEDDEKARAPVILPPTRKVPMWKRLFYDSWFGEILAVVFSALCLVAIVIVLAYFNGKPSPQKFMGLTLNAIVSILAGASKSSLIFVIASSTSQLKWVWFLKSRRLVDFECFDQASRGPLGSLAMLFNIGRQPIASAAALIMIFALAFDPFVQQVLEYPVRGVSKPSGDAMTVPGTVLKGVDPNGPDLARVINSGIWSPSPSVFDRQPTCPTGNCTWPVFPSVGWCSACEDLTHSARLTECDIASYINHPNSTNVTCTLGTGVGHEVMMAASGGPPQVEGYSYDHGKNTTMYVNAFNISREVAWTVWLAGDWTDIEDEANDEAAPLYKGVDPPYTNPEGDPLLNQTVCGIPNPPLVLAYASLQYNDYNATDDRGFPPGGLHVTSLQQCALSPCVRHYEVSTSNAVAQSPVVKTEWGYFNWNAGGGQYNIGEDPGANFVFGDTLCWAREPGNVTYRALENGMLVNMSKTAFCPVEGFASAIAQRLTSQSWGQWTYETGDTSEASSFTLLDNNALFDQVFSGSNGDVLQDLASDSSMNFSGVISNVAAAITKLGLSISNETMTGNMTSSEVFVEVHWDWMALPFALELAGIAVLILTMVWTRIRGARLWKYSALPLLYHGQHGSKQQEHGAVAEKLSAMNEAAVRTDFKLGRFPDDGRFMYGS